MIHRCAGPQAASVDDVYADARTLREGGGSSIRNSASFPDMVPQVAGVVWHVCCSRVWRGKIMRISSKQYLEATSQLSGNGEASQNELFAKIGSRKCFRDADANKDGVVTEDEVTLSEEAFARLDASRDGKVTQEEMDAAMSGHGQDVFSFYTSRRRAANSQDLLAGVLGASATEEDGDAAEKAAREYMTRMDADKDGVLTRQETSVSAAAFGNIDTSGNGSIELAEIQAALKIHDSRLSSYYASLQEDSSLSTLQKKV